MTNDMKTVNVFFCGTGGQGVLSASEVCGWAAVYEGYHVKKSEVHGMAQRGGSVESNIRFGKNVYAPLAPRGAVDYLVSFHKDEHDRCISMLKKGGADLLKSLEIAQSQITDQRFINTYLLGVLSQYLPISEESWLKALDRAFKTKNFEENKVIFLKGRSEGRP